MKTALPPAAEQRRREWNLVILMIAAVLMIGYAPYLLGHIQTPDDAVFIGHPYPLDTNRMFNEMTQGARHGFLFARNHLSLEDHEPAFLFHFYMFLGWLGAGLRLSAESMFHLARAVFGAGLIALIHAVAGAFFRHAWERLGFLTLLCCSAGFMGITEACTFQSITLFPHFSAAMLLMMTYYVALYGVGMGDRPLRSAGAGVVSVFLTGLVHPWNLIPMGVVSGGFILGFLFQRRAGHHQDSLFTPRRLVGFLAIFLSALTVVAIHAHTLKTNPVFAAMAKQNVMRFDNAWQVVQTLGFLWIGALAGCAVVFWRRRQTVWIYPAIGFLVTTLLILAPTPFQKRFLEGLHIPAALLTACAIFELARSIAPRLGRSRRTVALGLTVLAVALTIPGNILFLRFPYFKDPSDIYYPSLHVVTAAKWIDEELPEGVNFLGSTATGQILARYTLADVFVAHSVHTLNLKAKREEMITFYMGKMNNAQAQDFMRKHGIEYLFYGPREQAAPEFLPQRYRWLRPVYQESDVFIYKVNL